MTQVTGNQMSFVGIKWLLGEKIYEFFVGINKTVCCMWVSVDRGSTVIFFIVLYVTIYGKG